MGVSLQFETRKKVIQLLNFYLHIKFLPMCFFNLKCAM